MPRALTRDEQAIVAAVRHADGARPIPDLAAQLGLSSEAVQTACEYLVSRNLLHATVYAVAAPPTSKTPRMPVPAGSTR